MTVSNAVSERIRTILKEQNKSMYRLEHDVAIPHETMRYLMGNKTQSVNLKTVLLLIRGLGITASEFFDDPIFEDPDLEID